MAALAAVLLALRAHGQTTIVWDGSTSILWIQQSNWTPELSPNSGNDAQITDASPMTGASGTGIAPNSLLMDSAPATGDTPNLFTITASDIFWFKAASDSLRVHAGTLKLTANVANDVEVTAAQISVVSRSGLARELATLALENIDSSTVTDVAVGDGVNAAALTLDNARLTLSGTLTTARYSTLSVVNSSTLSAVTGNLSGALTADESTLSFNNLNLGAHADIVLTDTLLWLGSTPVITTGGQLRGTGVLTGAGGAAAAFTIEGTLDRSAPLTISSDTAYVKSTGPAVLGSTLTLVSATTAAAAGDIGTVIAPNGVRLPSGHVISGSGLIYGEVTDETGGAGLAGLSTQWEINYAFNAGSSQLALVGSPTFKQGLTLDGGTVRLLGNTPFLVTGAGLTGHGTIDGGVDLMTTGSTQLTLDGDLSVGRTSAQSTLQRGKIVNVGAHTLTLVNGAAVSSFGGSGSTRIDLDGGRVVAGGDGLTTNFISSGLELNGRGLLLDQSYTRANPSDLTVTATGAFTLTDNLTVGALRATFVSNASVNLGPSTTLAGGVMVSANGFTLAGSDTISGYGLIQGAVTDETGGGGGLAASGIFNGGSTIHGLGAGTVHVLSTAEAVFDYQDPGRSGALTLLAPNGVSLLHDTTAGGSTQTLNVTGNLTWRGGTLPGTLNVTGNLSGQNLAMTGTTAITGMFTGSGIFDGTLTTAGVVTDGSLSFAGWSQSSATTRLIAEGVTTTTGAVTLTGGAFTADEGLRFNASAKLAGHGTFTGYAAGGDGTVGDLTGNLTIGAQGAGGTVSFESISLYGPGASAYTGTVSIQADSAVTMDSFESAPGSTFASTNGAVTGTALVGYSNATATTFVRGAFTTTQLNLYSKGDFDSLTANTGNLYYDTLVRGTATLGHTGGTMNLGTNGEAITLGATQGVIVATGGGLNVVGTNARVVGALRADGAISGTALQVAGLVTGRGSIAQDVTLLASGQALDLNDAVVVDVTSSGLNPGRVGEAGLLTFSQNLTLASNSVLTFELGSTTRGTGYDAIDVGGTLTFGGTLTVNYVSAFVPQSGAVFALFNTGAVSGTFANLNLPSLADGLSWDTTALHTSGLLGVTGTAIPEPSTYVTIAGLLALGLAAWRRR